MRTCNRALSSEKICRDAAYGRLSCVTPASISERFTRTNVGRRACTSCNTFRKKNAFHLCAYITCALDHESETRQALLPIAANEFYFALAQRSFKKEILLKCAKLKLTTLRYAIQGGFRFGMMRPGEGVLIRPRAVLYVVLSQRRKGWYRTQPDIGDWRSNRLSDDEATQNL